MIISQKIRRWILKQRRYEWLKRGAGAAGAGGALVFWAIICMVGTKITVCKISGKVLGRSLAPDNDTEGPEPILEDPRNAAATDAPYNAVTVDLQRRGDSVGDASRVRRPAPAPAPAPAALTPRSRRTPTHTAENLLESHNKRLAPRSPLSARRSPLSARYTHSLHEHLPAAR